MSSLAPTLEGFFTDRLMRQRHASPNTVAAYRDTFCLLLGYLRVTTGKAPCRLDLQDVDAPTVAGFLQHLEITLHNGVRTRNARLSAIHSFFQHASCSSRSMPGSFSACLPSRRSASTQPSSRISVASSAATSSSIAASGSASSAVRTRGATDAVTQHAIHALRNYLERADPGFRSRTQLS